MKRIAIWGVGTSGKETYHRVKDCYEVVCFLDNDQIKEGQLYDNVEIIYGKNLNNVIKEKQIELILLGVSVMLYDDVYCQIQEVIPGFDEIYYVPVYWKELKLLKYTNLNEKPMIPFLGIEAVRACNLKCNACLHFSNIVEDLMEYDLEQLDRDFHRLSELFQNICCVRVAGGEPLLSDKLPQMFSIIKRYFPDCMVELITNGLKLIDIDNSLLRAIHEYEVRVNVTLYPPTKKIFSKIEHFCEENNISLMAYGEDRSIFTKRLYPQGHNSEKEIYVKCDINRCNIMRYGRITHCPLEMHGDFINCKYGTKLPEDGGYHFYNSESTGQDIKAFLRQSSYSCRYCGLPQELKWEVKSKNASLEDWTVCRIL